MAAWNHPKEKVIIFNIPKYILILSKIVHYQILRRLNALLFTWVPPCAML